MENVMKTSDMASVSNGIAALTMDDISDVFMTIIPHN